jgi:hypothetical protein
MSRMETLSSASRADERLPPKIANTGQRPGVVADRGSGFCDRLAVYVGERQRRHFADTAAAPGDGHHLAQFDLVGPSIPGGQ